MSLGISISVSERGPDSRDSSEGSPQGRQGQPLPAREASLIGRSASSCEVEAE